MSEQKQIMTEIKRNVMSDTKFAEELTEEELRELISKHLLEKERTYRLTLSQRKQMGKEIFDALRKFDVLQDFMDDDEITEIMVNGPKHIFVEKNGKVEAVKQQFESVEKLLQLINQMVSACNRSVNESSPIVDARIPKSGERINVVLSPIALNGPILTIRRFPKEPITMDKLMKLGAISKEASEFLENAVKAKYNIVISGGTGSGKTTFLNALSQYIPSDERIITIEDSAELQIMGIENLIRLETRSINIEGGKSITIRDLIKASLRMRPNRIIVGEVRGEEALDMIGSAMNCGHDGSMSSAHANSAKDMLSRLENMILMSAEIPISAIRRQIASGVDLIIHLGRLRDKSRRVIEIVEVVGIKEEQIILNPLYEFKEMEDSKKDQVKGSLEEVGKLIHTYKMEMAGLEI